MNLLFTIIVTFFAGMGAGLGTGFAGMSAAAVISPMLITFLRMDPFLGCAGQCGVGLYLPQKQESGYQERPDYDGQCAAVHRGGQLGGKPGAFHHHGQLLGVYDIPAGH